MEDLTICLTKKFLDLYNDLNDRWFLHLNAFHRQCLNFLFMPYLLVLCVVLNDYYFIP